MEFAIDKEGLYDEDNPKQFFDDDVRKAVKMHDNFKMMMQKDEVTKRFRVRLQYEYDVHTVTNGFCLPLATL